MNNERSKKQIAVLTATRAEWGLLRPLAEQIRQTPEFELALLVTGTHFCVEFGNTYQEILNDGFIIDERVDALLYPQSSAAITKTMSMVATGFADLFLRRQLDLLIVLGDRYETLAVCLAAMNANIPIAHLYGGETTEGAIDEAVRHSITKLSLFHFAGRQEYCHRIIQLGEAPARVFNAGALALDNIRTMELLTIHYLSDELHINLSENQYCVVTFHPVTKETELMASQLKELFSAISNHPNFTYLFTKSNSDLGGSFVNAEIDIFAAQYPNVYAVDSLGALKYLSALKHSRFVMGNSSSGLSEAPFLKIPSINIGNRQRGRLMAESVVSCECRAECIELAIRKVISDDFLNSIQNISCPCGDGHSAEYITNTLKTLLFKTVVSTEKVFYDIDY